MPITQNFSHHFLVAMPTLKDASFIKAVIYIHEHSEDGAMGFVINKPLTVSLGTVLQHIEITDYVPAVDQQIVLMGGPVGQEHGFVLHTPPAQLPTDTHQEICVSASREILLDIAQNKGPLHYLVTLGYTGWSANQLELEINRNDWLVVPYNNNIMFTVPMEQRWHKTAALLGVDINQLSGHVGHV
jgi:putative transcriptional regulator